MEHSASVISLLQSVVLGAIQGITEFLPISSSAHLILVPKVFEWPDQGLSFDVAANAGTLLAVLWVFRAEVVRFTRAAGARISGGERDRAAERLLLWLLLATVPVVLCGALFRPWIESQGRSMALVGFASIGFGLLLAVADWLVGRGLPFGRRRDVEQLRIADALWIGVAQAAALIPGTSRSGATMTAALFAGFDRETAARASFLLAIPVGLLASAYDLVRMIGSASTVDVQWLSLLTVVATSALTGYLVIRWLLAWLRRRSMMIFVIYRVVLGLLLLWLAYR